MAFDPASLSVFLDFDATVTVADTDRHVLERLGDPAWRSVDAAYRAGLLGRREAVSRQWSLVAGGIEAARPVAAEVGLDPGFVPLVDALRARGAEVTVVADGFGFYASEVCTGAGVVLLTNDVGVDGDIEFPWTDRCCACASCGVCKQAPIKEARRLGRSTVLVGRDIGDRKAALLADAVFAKDDLADWCDEAGVDYRPFARLDDVRRALLRT